ncbi:S-layer homology domain-containing protein [Cohnella rhizosphaerae]|uniref:S-layer homology domain-containing protein n=1 Tax=Cohnella rhizosphaerae TaxID=1457232 RepID=A0A9X4KY27_9BACL|nr:S-layer homology domain-containing protein [Cohnella rhizosphaerae]MDG0810444.1 S-layer homology domain-containing protein [Cohnella rhizosphaerae]
MIRRWISIATVIFLIMTQIPQYAFAGSIDTWTLRSPLPTGNILTSVTFGNGTFVAVGNKGTILTSSDGASWSSQASGTANILNKVIWGSNLFVAVGAGGTILTSADGMSWTSRASGLTTNIAGITYGNGLYVAVGNSGKIVTSTNGVNWTSRTSGVSTSYILYDVAYGNGMYAVAGSSGLIITSSDNGVTWQQKTSGYTSSLTDIAFGDGRFVALGDQGRTLFSNDGVLWSKSGTNSLSAAGISFDNGNFAAVGHNGAILTSANGVSWTTRSSGTTITLTGVTYGNGTYVVVGETAILTSPDGASWTDRMIGTLNSLLGLAYINDTYVGVGAGGTIITSGDGANWTAQASGTPNHLYGVVYANDSYVAVGLNGTIITSNDSVNWTKRTSGTSSQLTGIAYGNGIFVAAGAGGTIVTSVDGVNWTGRTSGTANNLTGVTFGNGLYIAVGNNGTIVTSSNGISWMSRTSGTANPLNGVVYGNDLYAAVGKNGTIVTSVDGVSWTNRTSNTANQLSGIVYGNGLYVAAGAGGTILTSGNGATWTSRTSGITNNLTAVAYGDGTYVAGGENGTIVQSDPVPPAITGVGITPDHASVSQGGSKQLAAVVDALDGVMTTVKWTSSDAGGKVTVDGAGKVAAAADAAPGDYTITATSTVDGSKKGTATITVIAMPLEPTPEAEIDYAAEQLTGLAPNAAYTVNGTPVTADGGGKAAIDASWLGSTVNVVKKGDGTTTTDSAAQTLSLPARPATPTAGKTDESVIGGSNGTLTNVTSQMEYKKASAGSWTSVAGTSVTGLAPDTYVVRVKATSSSFASAAQTVTIAAFNATPETKPEAEVDYAAEQLTGLAPNAAYTVNGTPVTADGGKVAIDAIWLGSTVNVVKKGDGTTTTDSAAQTLSLPARPATPTAGKTDESVIGGSNGTLTNVTSQMEYKKASAGSWTSVAGTSVTGLAPDTYVVRVKATSSSFASAAQTVTIAAFNATPETKPETEVDYAAEQLTELAPNAAYTVNGTPVTADGGGKVAIDPSWLGSTVNVVKKGDGTTTTDSAAQTLSLPARPAAPVDISVTDVTYNGANNGSILQLNIGMEFKGGNAETWTKVTGTSVIGLAPGSYDVRVAATESDFASIPAQVTIHDSDAILPAAPEVSADDVKNTIVGLDTTMEFSVDGDAYVRYDGTNMPLLSGEHTVQVRVAASGSVPAGPSTTLIFTTNVSVPAGGLTVTVTDPSGADHDGKTLITVTPAVNDEHRLVYFNFGNGNVIVPHVGDTLSGYANVPNDRIIPAANGDKIGVAEVDGHGQVVKFGQAAAIVIAEPPAPQPSNEGSTGVGGPKEESVDVLVNGKVENAGKATTTESGGVKTTTVAVDPAKLQAKLEAEGANAVVTIPVKSASNVVVGELNGRMIKNMESLSATLVLQTDKGTYTLPAKEIDIDALAGKLGSGVKLEDIQFKVTIAQTPDTMAKVVENAAAKGEFSVVVPAVDYTVSGTYGGKTVEVKLFNVYVERMAALPDGIDPDRITTGVVVDADGTARHVPTKIVLVDGKYYAKINSLTNSTYAVVWHPLEFSDVANHWAKAAVNDMGSRMVIDGTGGGRFSPDRAITRAEFAAIVVRGLGLKLENGTAAFSDVKASDWFGGAIDAASAYELIRGYEDGTFRPNDEITREEAMAIVSRAMAITGLRAKLPAQSDDAMLRSYKDASDVSGWARSGVQDNVQAGLVSGRGTALLAPKASITRAEVATVIQRLLQASGLI